MDLDPEAIDRILVESSAEGAEPLELVKDGDRPDRKRSARKAEKPAAAKPKKAKAKVEEPVEEVVDEAAVEEPAAEVNAFLNQFLWVRGPGTAPMGETAQIEVPAGFQFADGETTRGFWVDEGS